MRPLLVRLSFFFAALVLLSACGPRDSRFSPKGLHIAGDVWPPEIDTGNSSSGIYPVHATQDSADICCWLAPKAHFRLRKDSRDNVLQVALYVPKVPEFDAHPQAVTVRFGAGDGTSDRMTLKPGFNILSVPVRGRMRNATGLEDITILSSTPYQPLGSRGPTYGVLMTSVYFE